jgi:hypothetical protein
MALGKIARARSLPQTKNRGQQLTDTISEGRLIHRICVIVCLLCRTTAVVSVKWQGCFGSACRMSRKR